MKTSILRATVLSMAVTSAAGFGFSAPNKFSRTSFKERAEEMINNSHLEDQYRRYHGYEGNNPRNAECPPHLKDNTLYLLVAKGRNYDGQTQYIKGIDQINEIELYFSLHGKTECGTIGIKTIRPDDAKLAKVQWGTPFFLPEGDKSISKSEERFRSKIEQISVSPVKALSRGVKMFPPLKSGFKEVVLKTDYFYDSIHPIYVFDGLKKDKEHEVTVGGDIDRVQFFSEW